MSKHNEMILCVHKKSLPSSFLQHRVAIAVSENELVNRYLQQSYVYTRRKDAETDESLFQLIPYCIVQDEDKRFLTYWRRGSENRLHGKMSCGLGGHVSSDDNEPGENLRNAIHRGLQREMHEECGVSQGRNYNFEGVIAESESAAGRVHLGMVYTTEIHAAELQPSDEIREYQWMTRQEVQENIKNFETWSSLAIKLYTESLV